MHDEFDEADERVRAAQAALAAAQAARRALGQRPGREANPGASGGNATERTGE